MPGFLLYQIFNMLLTMIDDFILLFFYHRFRKPMYGFWLFACSKVASLVIFYRDSQ